MPRRISAELTRKEMIDPQLEKTGWYLRDCSKVKAGGLYSLVDSDYQRFIIQPRALRVPQSPFPQKRHLETADLYKPSLDMFGADAVERWFTVKNVEEVLSS